jgi:flagellar basal body rod protein FlgG
MAILAQQINDAFRADQMARTDHKKDIFILAHGFFNFLYPF